MGEQHLQVTATNTALCHAFLSVLGDVVVQRNVPPKALPMQGVYEDEAQL